MTMWTSGHWRVNISLLKPIGNNRSVSLGHVRCLLLGVSHNETNEEWANYLMSQQRPLLTVIKVQVHWQG